MAERLSSGTRFCRPQLSFAKMRLSVPIFRPSSRTLQRLTPQCHYETLHYFGRIYPQIVAVADGMGSPCSSMMWRGSAGRRRTSHWRCSIRVCPISSGWPSQAMVMWEITPTQPRSSRTGLGLTHHLANHIRLVSRCCLFLHNFRATSIFIYSSPSICFHGHCPLVLLFRCC